MDFNTSLAKKYKASKKLAQNTRIYSIFLIFPEPNHLQSRIK